MFPMELSAVSSDMAAVLEAKVSSETPASNRRSKRKASLKELFILKGIHDMPDMPSETLVDWFPVPPE